MPQSTIRDRVWSRDLGMRVVTTFYRRAVLFVRDLAPPDERTGRDAPDDLAEHDDLPPDVCIAPLNSGDGEAYSIFRSVPGHVVIDARMREGHSCFAVWQGGRIVHAAWVATGRTRVAYLGHDLVLAPNEALVYDSFTLPEYRDSRLARARMLHVFRRLRDRGFRRCFAILAVENVVGERALRSGGYRPLCHYACIRIGAWYACRARRGAAGEGAVPHLVRS